MIELTTDGINHTIGSDDRQVNTFCSSNEPVISSAYGVIIGASELFRGANFGVGRLIEKIFSFYFNLLPLAKVTTCRNTPTTMDNFCHIFLYSRSNFKHYKMRTTSECDLGAPYMQTILIFLFVINLETLFGSVRSVK